MDIEVHPKRPGKKGSKMRLFETTKWGYRFPTPRTKRGLDVTNNAIYWNDCWKRDTTKAEEKGRDRNGVDKAGDYRRWLGMQLLFFEAILVVLFHRWWETTRSLDERLRGSQGEDEYEWAGGARPSVVHFVCVFFYPPARRKNTTIPELSSGTWCLSSMGYPILSDILQLYGLSCP